MPTTEPVGPVAFLTDDAGTITAWNPGCEAFFGVPAELVLDKPMGMLLTDGDAQQWPERWRTLVEQARGAGLAVNLQCAAGKAASALMVLAPQQGRDGV